jgi:hypothetical protein
MKTLDRITELKQLIQKKEKELAKLQLTEARDFIQEAEEVMEKFFAAFPSGKKYLDKVASEVKKVGFVNARTGRKRHMFRVLTEKPALLASAERSAKNAPIQGFASEIGLKAAYLTLKEFDKTRRILRLTKGFPRYTRQVHDANYYEIRYEHVIVFLWIYQYTSTFGVANDYSRVYDIDFPVPPEIEIEISASEDKPYKWDWTLIHLRKCIESTIDDQIKLGILKEEERQEILDLILEPARDKKIMSYLQENYPLLNVNKLPKTVINDLIHP